MKFDSDKIYKVVFNDNGNVKAPKGKIIDYDDSYLTLLFEDGGKIFVAHKTVIRISEVNN